jgi:hypothetical protein
MYTFHIWMCNTYIIVFVDNCCLVEKHLRYVRSNPTLSSKVTVCTKIITNLQTSNVCSRYVVLILVYMLVLSMSLFVLYLTREQYKSHYYSRPNYIAGYNLTYAKKC